MKEKQSIDVNELQYIGLSHIRFVCVTLHAQLPVTWMARDSKQLIV